MLYLTPTGTLTTDPTPHPIRDRVHVIFATEVEAKAAESLDIIERRGAEVVGMLPRDVTSLEGIAVEWRGSECPRCGAGLCRVSDEGGLEYGCGRVDAAAGGWRVQCPHALGGSAVVRHVGGGFLPTRSPEPGELG